MRLFWQLLMSFFCLFAVTSCSPNPYAKTDGPIQVQLPLYSPEQGYFLAPTEIKTLTKIDRVEGSTADFYVEAKVDGEKMTGHAPVVRTVRSKSGVYVPTDVYSLQLLTLYHHIEKLREIDIQLNVWGKAPSPRRVAVFLPMVNANGEAEVNARYSSELDAFLFSPFPDESLPLMANGGVIAHEHFHSFFAHQVVKPLDKKYPKEETERDQYHQFLFRALNEGLADVWGWAYSGDDDFVRRSIPRESYLRKMTSPLIQIRSAETLFSQLMNDSKLSYYALGSDFAKFIRLIAVNQSKDRFEAAALAQKWIVQFLPKIKEEYLKLGEDQLWEPSDILVSFAATAQFEKAETCPKLEAYLQKMQGKILCTPKANP